MTNENLAIAYHIRKKSQGKARVEATPSAAPSTPLTERNVDLDPKELARSIRASRAPEVVEEIEPELTDDLDEDLELSSLEEEPVEELSPEARRKKTLDRILGNMHTSKIQDT